MSGGHERSGVLWLVVLVILMGVGVEAGRGVAPPLRLTAAQRARLKERDRLGVEASRLLRAGKLEQAIALWGWKTTSFVIIVYRIGVRLVAGSCSSNPDGRCAAQAGPPRSVRPAP